MLQYHCGVTGACIIPGAFCDSDAIGDFNVPSASGLPRGPCGVCNVLGVPGVLCACGDCRHLHHHKHIGHQGHQRRLSHHKAQAHNTPGTPSTCTYT